MQYTVRPISDLTIFNTADPKPNPFRAPWSDTLNLLGYELGLLDARDVVFEIDCREGDIRNDGMLYAKAKVGHRGVRIAFESKYGPLTYATDRYQGRWTNDPPDWQINVRAIALGLEALRAVDRYGVTRRGEQYTGFKALPAGRAMPASHMTTDDAWSIIGSYGPGQVTIAEMRRRFDAGDRAEVSGAYRRARAANHPDRRGDRTLWDRVEQAATVLRVKP